MAICYLEIRGWSTQTQMVNWLRDNCRLIDGSARSVAGFLVCGRVRDLSDKNEVVLGVIRRPLMSSGPPAWAPGHRRNLPDSTRVWTPDPEGPPGRRRYPSGGLHRSSAGSESGQRRGRWPAADPSLQGSDVLVAWSIWDAAFSEGARRHSVPVCVSVALCVNLSGHPPPYTVLSFLGGGVYSSFWYIPCLCHMDVHDNKQDKY